MIAVINPAAAGGRALAKWSRIEERLQGAVGPFATFVCPDPGDLDEAVAGFLDRGHRRIMVAGGDGTVGAVLGAIVAHADREMLEGIAVGAVGLGSSNDYHKPFAGMIDGVPCRLDFGRVRRHDIGRLDYDDAGGAARTRYWFINASIGVAAEANHFFNHPDRTLRRLKRVWTGGAISYAALRAIMANRPQNLTLTIDGRRFGPVRVRNLGVVKNPHFAGSLRYDSPHRPDSGRFHVHGLGARTRAGLVRALVRLARGRFSGGRATRSWLAREAAVVNGGDSFLVECDGEVIEARAARFSIVPGKLRLCS